MIAYNMEKLVGAVLVDEGQPLLEFRPAELMAKSRELGLLAWIWTRNRLMMTDRSVGSGRPLAGY